MIERIVARRVVDLAREGGRFHGFGRAIGHLTTGSSTATHADLRAAPATPTRDRAAIGAAVELAAARVTGRAASEAQISARLWSAAHTIRSAARPTLAVAGATAARAVAAAELTIGTVPAFDNAGAQRVRYRAAVRVELVTGRRTTVALVATLTHDQRTRGCPAAVGAASGIAPDTGIRGRPRTAVDNVRISATGSDAECADDDQ